MNNKRLFLTIEQKRQRILNDEDMPTAIFLADKREFVVKPRGTIFGKGRGKRKRRLLV